MTRLATALTTLGILTAGLAVLFAPGAGAATASEPIGFGMESSAIQVQTDNGVAPDYGTFWLGPWTLSSGWAGPDNQLTNMKNQGVTPAIHFYYWGDDISPSCVENGCWSSLHNSQKDRAGWNRLADEMISHLNSKMQGEEVVIFMESEFNKGGIETYEPFDGYLSEMNQKIKAGYPNAEIVLSLGSWGRHHWGNFDRSAATSDLVGIQGMRGSTRDSSAHYDDLYETTLDNAQYLQGLFGKPIFIQDLALSSYPEPEYLSRQAAELQQFFDNLPALKQAGVMAIVYRSWNDSPGMNLANYYGHAERHWGFSWSGTTALKEAGYVWINGVQAERANAAPAPAPAPTGPFTATFTVPSGANEYWVEVKVDSSHSLSKVEASHNGGSYTTLPATSWGTHAKSFYAPAGSMVFKATSTTGATVTSDSMQWLGGSTPAAEPEPTPEPEPVPEFTATFTPKAVGNEWWIETAVSSTSTITKVEAKVDAGSYTLLPATSWGTYAKSIHVAPGATVTFRATDDHAQTQTSSAVSWTAPAEPAPEPVPEPSPEPAPEPSPEPSPEPVTETPTAPSGGAGAAPAEETVSEPVEPVLSSEPAEAFEADITTLNEGSRRRIAVAVDGSQEISTVEVSLDGGDWKTMHEIGDGEYRKIVRLGKHVDVQFRVTSVDGDVVLSDIISWT